MCASNSVSLDWTLKPQKQLHISSAVAVVLFLFKRIKKKRGKDFERERARWMSLSANVTFRINSSCSSSIHLVFFSALNRIRLLAIWQDKIVVLGYYVMLRSSDAVVVIFSFACYRCVCGPDKDRLTL